MVDYYLWFKALHIMSFITWMAGMFYLPRLFVYHTRVAQGSESDGLFRVMEQKLLRIIINPAMVATLIFGICLILANTSVLHQGWMHGKFLLLFILFGFHGFLAKTRKDFIKEDARGSITRSERFYRLINEVPTVLMIGIVLLAVLKPF